jgi:hypothetical protein
VTLPSLACFSPYVGSRRERASIFALYDARYRVWETLSDHASCMATWSELNASLAGEKHSPFSYLLNGLDFTCSSCILST